MDQSAVHGWSHHMNVHTLEGATTLRTEPAVSKSRLITASLADMVIDLLLPTAVYLLLAPTHMAAVIRLALGGFLIAAGAGTTASIAAGTLVIAISSALLLRADHRHLD